MKVPKGDLVITGDGSEATLTVENAKVVDSFQFLGERQVPATVSFQVHWKARDPDQFVERGKGLAVPPTSKRAFLGRFATADAEGTFSGSNADGFSFTSDPGAVSVWAEIGTERNGEFLS